MTGTQRQEVVGFWGVGGSDQALHRVHLSRWIGLELGWRGGLSWQRAQHEQRHGGGRLGMGVLGAEWREEGQGEVRLHR